MARFTPPPPLLERFLRWSLPPELKELVLGDLAEEYQTRHHNNSASAKQWYIQQALRTVNHYIWHTKRGMLMFILSLLVFAAVSAMAFLFGSDGDLLTFIDGPSLLLIFPPALAFAIGATSIQDMKNAFAVVFNDELKLSSVELKTAQQFYRVMGNSSLLMALFTTFIGAVAISVNLENFATEFGPAFGVCILVLMYSFGLKTLCYVAEQKIQYRINLISEIV
ncbi:hypothetical protein ACFOEE_00485 [Pseudoalteromonas fenneropenaei]|uniref:Uncharacterized protein n=1 Tax=Pseudoalteromonas fenneropenaei TaxID=1737459 RepID=A0ABV7CEK6_9GAMM